MLKWKEIWAGISHAVTALGIWQLVSGFISASAAIILSYLQQLPWALWLILGLFGFALGIWIANLLTFRQHGYTIIKSTITAENRKGAEEITEAPETPNTLDTYFEKKRIRLNDFLQRGESLLEGKIFERCEIIGPTVIYLMDGTALEGCDFEGSIDTAFLVAPDNKSLMGIVGLKNCRLLNCRLRNISIIGVASQIERIKDGFIE